MYPRSSKISHLAPTPSLSIREAAAPLRIYTRALSPVRFDAHRRRAASAGVPSRDAPPRWSDGDVCADEVEDCDVCGAVLPGLEDYIPSDGAKQHTASEDDVHDSDEERRARRTRAAAREARRMAHMNTPAHRRAVFELAIADPARRGAARTIVHQTAWHETAKPARPSVAPIRAAAVPADAESEGAKVSRAHGRISAAEEEHEDEDDSVRYSSAIAETQESEGDYRDEEAHGLHQEDEPAADSPVQRSPTPPHRSRHGCERWSARQERACLRSCLHRWYAAMFDRVTGGAPYASAQSTDDDEDRQLREWNEQNDEECCESDNDCAVNKESEHDGQGGDDSATLDDHEDSHHANHDTSNSDEDEDNTTDTSVTAVTFKTAQVNFSGMDKREGAPARAPQEITEVHWRVHGEHNASPPAPPPRRRTRHRYGLAGDVDIRHMLRHFSRALRSRVWAAMNGRTTHAHAASSHHSGHHSRHRRRRSPGNSTNEARVPSKSPSSLTAASVPSQEPRRSSVTTPHMLSTHKEKDSHTPKAERVEAASALASSSSSSSSSRTANASDSAVADVEDAHAASHGNAHTPHEQHDALVESRELYAPADTASLLRRTRVVLRALRAHTRRAGEWDESGRAPVEHNRRSGSRRVVSPILSAAASVNERSKSDIRRGEEEAAAAAVIHVGEITAHTSPNAYPIEPNMDTSDIDAVEGEIDAWLRRPNVTVGNVVVTTTTTPMKTTSDHPLRPGSAHAVCRQSKCKAQRESATEAGRRHHRHGRHVATAEGVVDHDELHSPRPLCRAC